MKRLIFLIFTLICGIILYTCASPLMVDSLPTDTYYSSKAIMNDIFLGVNVTSSQIIVGFTAKGTTPNTSDAETVSITDSETGNAISGTYPNISFQNGLISGSIRFISDEQIKISFQQRIYPYTKMWDVICEKNNATP
ncbi:hypothetical protein [Brachyspira sp.]|uniref:hypothetical protein n=1 Tax=Brachyspira sp. TaxID=1977261 RepID=UPI003D7DAE70